ncbi:hypothetical protein AMTR_s00007p00186980 [Amborella trichopoda]|uniref:Flotillin-like n=1 Tax=Amborella trichopoda TaxID=13333 RepID=W1PBN0_AMBTC|nr:hypothetical protein AMTR_s00007p00186980 [Amborella trichopoda]
MSIKEYSREKEAEGCKAAADAALYTRQQEAEAEAELYTKEKEAEMAHGFGRCTILSSEARGSRRGLQGT